MKTIKLKRPKEISNKKCLYRIFIDDKEIASLKRGETKIMEVPKTGKLTAKMRYVGSKEYDIGNIENGSQITIEANSRMMSNITSLPSLLLSSIALFLSNSNTSKIISIVLVTAMLFIIIASVTIWKNRWINIKLYL